MIAFEAATPFQIFNCINIYSNLNTKEKADIYLYTYASDLRHIARRLSEAEVFEHIYLLENIPKPGRIHMISAVLKPEKLMEGIALKKYSSLYISYSGIPNMLLYNLLYKQTKKLKLYFYEDGVSSYYNGLFQHAKSVDLIRKMRGLRNDTENVEKVLLYEPRLNSVVYKTQVVERMFPTCRADILQKLDYIYAITDKAKELLSASEYLYFDHDYKKYVSDEFFFNFNQNEIVNKIAEIVGKILVKVSPLSDIKNSAYEGEGVIVSNFERAPWEILIHQDKSLESKCLITVCSNAVITPKTIYGREPYVLILGKALYNSGLTNSTDVWTESMGKYYDKVLEIYENKEKFCVAGTMEEAELFLNAILKKKNGVS